MRISDWSSDVCSSDLLGQFVIPLWLHTALAPSVVAAAPFAARDDLALAGDVDAARELADRQLPTPDRAQDVAGPQVLVMGLELEGAKPLAVAAADELLRLRHPHPSVRQAADRILGGDPLNGLIVQVFSEVLRRAHPRDQLASACVVQVLVQRLHRDTLQSLM